MRHDWEDVPSTVADPHWYGKRKCRNCGAVQTREDQQNWGRVTGYRWFPLVGRCKAKDSKRTDAMSHWNYNTEANRTCPLRKIVSIEQDPRIRIGSSYTLETLECGHINKVYAYRAKAIGQRRRCVECRKDKCR